MYRHPSDLSEAAGHPIVYSRFAEEFLRAQPDLAQMTASLENGPLADHVDLDIMREMNPQLLSFRSWLAGSGRKSLNDALAKTSVGKNRYKRLIQAMEDQIDAELSLIAKLEAGRTALILPAWQCTC